MSAEPDSNGYSDPERGDWLSMFMDYTEGTKAPIEFLLWVGIATVAAALERRVWTYSIDFIYPNLFTMLVSGPGTGKTNAINHGVNLLRDARLFLAPRDLTRAALIDSFGAAKRMVPMANGNQREYHSLLVAASEMGVLIPTYDTAFLAVLNDIFDNPKNYDLKRVTGGKEVDIIYPQINLLLGAQPAYLGSAFPEDAWNTGFMSRIIMVFGERPENTHFWARSSPEGRDELRAELLAGLVRMTKQVGEFAWRPDARAAIEAWHIDNEPPVPDHSRLVHYNTRRIIHVTKLCMISAVMRGPELVVTLDDFERAKCWLFETETKMPEVFRQMISSKSDGELLKELHRYCTGLWSLDPSKELSESVLWTFLKDRTPSEKIPKVIETAVRSDLFDVIPGSPAHYRPRPKA